MRDHQQLKHVLKAAPAEGTELGLSVRSKLVWSQSRLTFKTPDIATPWGPRSQMKSSWPKLYKYVNDNNNHSNDNDTSPL